MDSLTGWQRQASPHAVPERDECQQRVASSSVSGCATGSPARPRISSASFSCTPNALVTRTASAGKGAAASATIRGMSPVECLPGESMYGKTISSVAPASTHARTPSEIDGSHSSMWAYRTTTSGPAIA